MVAERSAFNRGWSAAKAKYPEPPKSKAVEAIEPPRELVSEIERESYIDGYLAWCSGKYHGRDWQRRSAAAVRYREATARFAGAD